MRERQIKHRCGERKCKGPGAAQHAGAAGRLVGDGGREHAPDEAVERVQELLSLCTVVRRQARGLVGRGTLQHGPLINVIQGGKTQKHKKHKKMRINAIHFLCILGYGCARVFFDIANVLIQNYAITFIGPKTSKKLTTVLFQREVRPKTQNYYTSISFPRKSENTGIFCSGQ